MKNKGSWIAFISLLVFGMGVVLYFGISPKPIPKITLSEFSGPDLMAEALIIRLRQEMQNSPVIFLGVDSEQPSQLEIWKDLLLRIKDDPKLKFDSLVLDSSLPDIANFEGAEKMDVREGIDELGQSLQSAILHQQRVAVIAPNIYTSQLIHQNPVSVFKQKTGVQPLSLSVSGFSRSRSGESEMAIPCVVQAIDEVGTGPLGCMILQEGRTLYRKKMKPGYVGHVGLVDQVGANDYLVLWTIEKKSK